MANKKTAAVVACAIAAGAILLLFAWRPDYAPPDGDRPTDEKGGTTETTKSSAPASDLVAVGTSPRPRPGPRRTTASRG
jgi:hypothetical protein